MILQKLIDVLVSINNSLVLINQLLKSINFQLSEIAKLLQDIKPEWATVILTTITAIVSIIAIVVVKNQNDHTIFITLLRNLENEFNSPQYLRERNSMAQNLLDNNNDYLFGNDQTIILDFFEKLGVYCDNKKKLKLVSGIFGRHLEFYWIALKKGVEVRRNDDIFGFSRWENAERLYINLYRMEIKNAEMEKKIRQNIAQFFAFEIFICGKMIDNLENFKPTKW